MEDGVVDGLVMATMTGISLGTAVPTTRIAMQMEQVMRLQMFLKILHNLNQTIQLYVEFDYISLFLGLVMYVYI